MSNLNPNSFQDPGQNVSAIAIATLMQIQNKTLDPTTLTEDRRLICTRHLLHEGKYTYYEIAQILQVSERTIGRYKKKLREGQELACLIIDEGSLAQDLIEDAELCSARLRKAGKWKEAFEVKIKLVESLQTMGIVKEVPKKLNLKGQIDLLDVLELNRQMREESPDNGEENNESNGNGSAGNYTEGGSRLE